MNKRELIDALAAKTAGLTKTQLGAVVEGLIHTIQDELVRGGRVQLIGFGTFATGQRAARTGRDPRTGKPLQIAAATTVRFTAGQAFKGAVNPPNAGKGQGKDKGKGKKKK